MKSDKPKKPTAPDSRYLYRSRHRARNHLSAQERAKKEGRVVIPHHPLICRNEAEIIDTQKGLDDVLAYLEETGSFAYDTEFIGEMTYFPMLCLIQVATFERVILIDPLADLDLTGLWELLADPAVEKILHAGKQDLEPVVRLLGKSPANIFDTQIAAGFINLPYPLGLGKLIQEMVGVRLPKGMTVTQWDERPLTEEHLRYGADDVRYLPAVRAEIFQRLEDFGHTRWALEECAALCEMSGYQFDPHVQFLKVRGASSLSPREAAVLRELVILRDRLARNEDAPIRLLLKDEALIEMARRPVRKPEDVNQLNALPARFKRAHGKDILAATAKGLALPESDWPVKDRYSESPADRVVIDSLWAVAQSLCAGHSIDSGLVTNRPEITDFQRHVVRGEKNVDCRVLHGWRHELVGATLESLLEGKTSLHLEWINGRLQAKINPREGVIAPRAENTTRSKKGTPEGSA